MAIHLAVACTSEVTLGAVDVCGTINDPGHQRRFKRLAGVIPANAVQENSGDLFLPFILATTVGRAIPLEMHTDADWCATLLHGTYMQMQSC